VRRAQPGQRGQQRGDQHREVQPERLRAQQRIGEHAQHRRRGECATRGGGRGERARGMPRAERADGGHRGHPCAVRTVGEGAEAPLARGELDEGARQLDRVEVGPHHRREPELRVGALPEQEVAQRRSPPVRIRRSTSGAGPASCIAAPRRAANAARSSDAGSRGAAAHRVACRLHDRVAGRVVERDAQAQLLAARGGRLRPVDGAAQRRIESVAPADHREPHAVGDAARGLALQVALEEAHEAAHLVLGPAPVVAREGVERQRVHAPRAAPRPRCGARRGRRRDARRRAVVRARSPSARCRP
jgi:hypothetical protein